jgi:hypothetical protein
MWVPPAGEILLEKWKKASEDRPFTGEASFQAVDPDARSLEIGILTVE